MYELSKFPIHYSEQHMHNLKVKCSLPSSQMPGRALSYGSQGWIFKFQCLRKKKLQSPQTAVKSRLLQTVWEKNIDYSEENV